MSGLTLALAVLLVGMTIRHGLVLGSIVRSHRFLARSCPAESEELFGQPTFYIVIPVLREAGILRQAVDHFEVVTKGHDATVVIVTTAREEQERAQYPDVADTVHIAAINSPRKADAFTFITRTPPG